MSSRTEPYVVVNLTGYSFAIPMSAVTSIERVDRLTPCADESGAVGLLERGSRSWPVYLLGRLVQVSEPRVAPNSQVVILKHRNREFGVLVDSVSVSERLSSDHANKLPFGFAEWERYLYSGTILRRDQALMILSIAALACDEPAESQPAPWQSPTGVASDQLLVFDRGRHEPNVRREYGLGVAAGAVREILDVDQLTPLPPNPSWIVGVTVVRSQPVAVVDLGMKTGIRQSPDPIRKIVLVNYPGGLLAFQAGSNISLRHRTQPNIPSRRAHSLRTDAVSAVIDFNDVTVALPDLKWL